MGSVFISYRREDSEGQARALFQALVARLGRDSVFMDVDSIGLGRDFRADLQERMATCDVMLALIGQDWVDGKDKSGRRRLDIPGDFVRMEIAAALKRNIPVTPLLLHGAQMPIAEQLPEDLSDLAYRNGFELSHNRWESDVQELFKRLGLATRNDTPSGATQPPKKPWFAIAGASVVAIAVAVGGFLYYEKTAREKQTADIEAPLTAANTEMNKSSSDAENAKANAPAGKVKGPTEAAKAAAASPSTTKNLRDSPLIERKPANSGISDKRGGQENTHTFNSADLQSTIGQEKGRHRELLRKAIDAAAKGDCPASMMTPLLRSTCEDQQPKMGERIKSLGPIRNLEFMGTQQTPMGPTEVFRVEHQYGKITWMISTDSEGKILVFWSPG